MKELTPCIYCLTYFEDFEKNEVCEQCAPKLFIDTAIIAIEQAIADLESVREIESKHLLKRNKIFGELSRKLDQLQQLE
jgi:hypothetical protein